MLNLKSKSNSESRHQKALLLKSIAVFEYFCDESSVFISEKIFC